MTKTTNDTSPAKTKTREHLIQTAIHLFAAQGFYGPSLRAVGKAAGQKNTAAVHYHFKDRDGLLSASLAYILEAMSAIPKHEPETTEPGATRAITAALLDAFVPVLTLPDYYPEWGGAGLRFIARVIHGESENLSIAFEELTAQDANAFLSRVSPLLPNIPADLLRARFNLSAITVISAVVAATHVEHTGQQVMSQERSVEVLFDYIAAGLCTPPFTN